MKKISSTIIAFFILINCFSQEKQLQNLTQLTFGGDNAEAYFSPDGKQLVFSSNRNNNNTKDTNLFIADWIE